VDNISGLKKEHILEFLREIINKKHKNRKKIDVNVV
jgi:hypothetical protein